MRNAPIRVRFFMQKDIVNFEFRAYIEQMRILITVLLVFFSVYANAEESAISVNNNSGSKVYKHVGEDGVVEFSDRAESRSQVIKIPKANTYAAPKIKSSSADNDEKQVSENPVADYQLAIVSPTNEQTLRSNNGSVAVSVSVSPALQTDLGHQLELFVDGKSQGKQSGGSYALQNMNRGKHSVIAKVVSRSGGVIQTSRAISFFIQRYSILNKAVKAPSP